jgi:hypothetical protein
VEHPTLEHSRHLIYPERNNEDDQPGEGESQTELLPELHGLLQWTLRSTYLLQLLMPARKRGRLVAIIRPFALMFVHHQSVSVSVGRSAVIFYRYVRTGTSYFRSGVYLWGHT